MTRFEREVYLQASPGQIWPLLSDTARVNRAVGLPEVDYRVKGSGPGSITLAKARIAGLTLNWQELPFEWVRDRFYSVTRKYDGGPFKEARSGMELIPKGEGTLVKIHMDISSRLPLGDVAARYTIWPFYTNRFDDMLREVESRVNAGKGANPLARRVSGVADAGRLGQLMAELEQTPVLDKPTLKLLAEHLQTAPEDEVVGMRPFVLADKWGLDRTATLRVFLYATRIGMLDLSWEVLCPGCRKSRQIVKTLRNLKRDTHCDSCHIDFGADFDQLVEARFSVNPSVRIASKREFCIGGPANTPHIIAQLRVAPDSERTIELDLDGSSVVATAPPQGPAFIRPMRGGAQEVTVSLGKGGISASVTEVATGPVRFHFENHTAQEARMMIAVPDWTKDAATAAIVTAMQEFRDLFSSEVLSADQQISVRNVTLLFTDLVGSTATYQKIGDARAYSLVRDHFTVLKDVVSRNNGAIVKTIGDAIMAVFPTPLQGLRAGLEMHNAIDDFNISRNQPPEVILKVGVHTGPAIAVNAHNLLDYFGTTVNQAARIQGLSEGRDVVASREVFDAAGAKELIGKLASKQEPFMASLKGIDKPVPVLRMWPRP